MKKLILTLAFAIPFFCSAQEGKGTLIDKIKVHSLRELEEYYQGAGKDVLNITDRCNYYIYLNQNSYDEYPVHIAVKNDSTIEVYGHKMEYDSTKNTQVFIGGSDHILEVVLNNGKLFIFKYQTLVDEEKIKEKEKFFKKMDTKERSDWNKQQLAKFPGCEMPPMINGKYGERQLVMRQYYNIYFAKWRFKEFFNDPTKPREYEERFARKQSDDERIANPFERPDPTGAKGTIQTLINWYNNQKCWDYVQTDTDTINRMLSFYLREGRGVAEINYIENGMTKCWRFVPYPNTIMNKFITNSFGDVYHVKIKKGSYKVLYYPADKALYSNVNEEVVYVIEWQLNFDTQEWSNMGTKKYKKGDPIPEEEN